MNFDNTIYNNCLNSHFMKYYDHARDLHVNLRNNQFIHENQDSSTTFFIPNEALIIWFVNRKYLISNRISIIIIFDVSWHFFTWKFMWTKCSWRKLTWHDDVEVDMTKKLFRKVFFYFLSLLSPVLSLSISFILVDFGHYPIRLG